MKKLLLLTLIGFHQISYARPFTVSVLQEQPNGWACLAPDSPENVEEALLLQAQEKCENSVEAVGEVRRERSDTLNSSPYEGCSLTIRVLFSQNFECNED
ncbi:MAG: hypothetical protein CL678_11385 [Bdellovibrionaceae bacterium]|nr:hypothetical protein [Pseudobdellovibrionaceae bacterium]|tara:strand:+ start:521 stop:820 length:300 start_codon:yes stop_codon:yes gene_type:complete